MGLSIRTATPADIATIVEYNCKLAWETVHKQLDPPVISAGVAAALADPAGKGPYYLACDGKEIVGQLQITLEWSDWRNGWFWWIQSVYVRADARGQGVFRALYKNIQDQAKAAGNVVGIRLYVERANLSAQATYLRLGMEMMPYLMLEESLLKNSEPRI